MTMFIARAAHGRPGRHPLALALAAALMLAEPCTGSAHAQAPHARADFAAKLGLRSTGTRMERHPPVPDRPAATIVVESCADTGAGSLRDALANAVNGDLIDLTQLACSTITLASGGIIASVDEVELVGPGANALTIDAAYHGRAFYHLGYATFALTGLRVTRGTYSGGPYYGAFGGCVFSKGHIELTDSAVDHCAVSDAVTDAFGTGGGCLLASGNVTLTDSSVSECTVTATSDDTAVGGGLFAERDIILVRSRVSGSTITNAQGETAGGGALAIEDLVMKYSTISDNGIASDYLGRAGGIYVQGDAYLIGSTISGNRATVGGGIWMSGSNNPASPARILNSTISGNVADVSVGGIVANMPLILANSTVAFNTSVALNVSGLYIGYDTELESSIIANNSAGSTQRDVGGSDFASITGANNLVGVTFLTLPPDTISSDAMLAPLANNGGRTKTHALLAGSVAIDAGNNSQNLTRDQRGTGFARVVGANADIGAFEADPGRIFTNGFEG
jgi:hypothetical protein